MKRLLALLTILSGCASADPIDQAPRALESALVPARSSWLYWNQGTDLGTAWRERLRREGKLGAAGSSVRDLVLGPREQA